MRRLGTEAETRILRYLRERIGGSGDPRRLGHALTGDRKGLWRYRIGDYRIVASIEDERLSLVVASGVGDVIGVDNVPVRAEVGDHFGEVAGVVPSSTIETRSNCPMISAMR